MAGYCIVGAIVTVFVFGSLFMLYDIIWNNEVEENYVVRKKPEPESLASLISDDYDIEY